MAPKYILHYFQVASRGEFIRLIFKHADIDYSEKTFLLTKDVPKIKENGDLYPLGQLPVLELENGETIAESHAIVRYLGNELGLYGKSNHDKVIIDQTLDSLKHVEETLWITYFLTTDPDAKPSKLKKLFEDTLPRAFRMIEKFLKKNNNGKSFLVGESITIGDIHIMATIETILLPGNENYRNILDDFPLIKNLNKRVRESPRIKAYLDKRGPPPYDFVH